MNSKGNHPVLPRASTGACPHEHLRFKDGSFLIECIDCEQLWAGLDKSTGAHALHLKSIPMYPPRDTRHDRWVIARTEKAPKPTPLKHTKIK
jgi:hypothetical protein